MHFNSFAGLLVCATLSLISIQYPVFSQSTTRKYQEVTIASPNSASLGKFADIPVNYHTGIPGISIPLYTAESGSLKLPIGLSYHASGLKVMERASWVGAGWALEAGGMITRSVMGGIDEWVPFANSYFRGYGYYDYLYVNTGNGLIVQDWIEIAEGRKDAEPDLFFFNFNGYSGKFYFRGDRTPVILSQQDIHIKVQACEGVTGCNTSTEYIYGFILTVPDGTKYYFGKEIGGNQEFPAFERTSIFSDLPSDHMPSSWYLYKIESADTRFKIDLKYVPEDYAYYSLALFPESTTGGISLTKNIIHGVRLAEVSFANGKVVFNGDTNPREDLSMGITSMDDLDNVEAKALKSIEIKDAETTIKSFVFDYDYFVDTSHPLKGILAQKEIQHNIHTDKKRLKLKSVQEIGRNSENKPAHIFTYQGGTVPRGLSFAQDHWGYYNGAVDNEHLTPAISINGNPAGPGTIGAANRETGWPSMANGILTKIQYPTGGYTEFAYGSATKSRQECVTETKWTLVESVTSRYDGNSLPGVSKQIIIEPGEVYKIEIVPSEAGIQGNYYIDGSQSSSLTIGTHQFSASATAPSGKGIKAELYKQTRSTTCNTIYSYIGAMRIEKITHSDGDADNDEIVTTYEYPEGSGVLFSRPTYAYILRNNITRLRGTDLFTLQGCRYTSPGGPLMYIVSSGSIHPMQTTQGSHYGYREVNVRQSNGGYSIYKYHAPATNLQDVSGRTINVNVCDANTPEYPPVPVKHDFDRGKLVYDGIFTVSGQKIRETFYTTTFEEDRFNMTGLKVQRVQDELWAAGYNIVSARKKFERVEERTYNTLAQSDPPVIKITDTDYDSPNHTQPTKVTVLDGEGGKKLKEIRYKYAGDITACNVTPSCLSDYTYTTDALFVNYQTSVFNCSNTDIPCLKPLWEEYEFNLNEARKAYISCLRQSNINETNYQSCLDDRYQSVDQDSKPVIDLKKLNMKATLLETSEWKEDLFTGSEFIQYRRFSDTPLELHPEKIYTVRPSSPLTNVFTTANISENSFTKDARYAQEVILNYKDGNVVETKGRDGVPVSYIWGINNTRPIVKASGVPVSTLNAAYTAVSGDLGTLRSQPSLSGALINTYTYSPLEGMTSQTDANGRTTFYEYDGLGRLIFIKDHNGNIVRNFVYHFNGE